MQVILKVVGGKNDGREIKVAVPEFIIGRGEEAHLRPTSDLVSRRHTAIRTNDGKVIIEDLNSRNGTFVNGEQITEPHVVKVGDTLRVGRLQFEVVIDHVKPGNKKPKVVDVVEAAARTASAAAEKRQSIEDSIADWLVDDDDEPNSEEKLAINKAETIQMKLEDTLAMSRDDIGQETKQVNVSADSEVLDSTIDESSGSGSRWGKKKKEPGKLPPVPKMSQGSSTSAADDVLRKFFNRR